MVNSWGAVFLAYFRKTDIAKNVVLQRELVSFPYGAKAVHRSSVVMLNLFRKTKSNRGPSNKSFYEVNVFLKYFRKTTTLGRITSPILDSVRQAFDCLSRFVDCLSRFA